MTRFFCFTRVCPAEKAGRAVRCIFIFLKKENKGCRFHPSHDVLYIKVILVQLPIVRSSAVETPCFSVCV